MRGREVKQELYASAAGEVPARIYRISITRMYKNVAMARNSIHCASIIGNCLKLRFHVFKTVGG
jgi:hypothetical protein